MRPADAWLSLPSLSSTTAENLNRRSRSVRLALHSGGATSLYLQRAWPDRIIRDGARAWRRPGNPCPQRRPRPPVRGVESTPPSFTTTTPHDLRVVSCCWRGLSAQGG